MVSLFLVSLVGSIVIDLISRESVTMSLLNALDFANAQGFYKNAFSIIPKSFLLTAIGLVISSLIGAPQLSTTLVMGWGLGLGGIFNIIKQSAIGQGVSRMMTPTTRFENNYGYGSAAQLGRLGSRSIPLEHHTPATRQGVVDTATYRPLFSNTNSPTSVLGEPPPYTRGDYQPPQLGSVTTSLL